MIEETQMRLGFAILAACALPGVCAAAAWAAGPQPEHDLVFDDLATRWDEAIPLGNGMLGALIWREGDVLRFSLDRADLWDLRPVEEFKRPEFRFAWVREQVLKGDYDPVHELIDLPYNRDAAPTKIPAGRLEFDASHFGEVESVRLHLDRAVCEVKWKSGVTLETFVHATEPIGWYRFTGLSSDPKPRVAPPPFGGLDGLSEEELKKIPNNDLRRLGYKEPRLTHDENSGAYHQETQNLDYFQVNAQWTKPDAGVLTGAWSASQDSTLSSEGPRSEYQVQRALKEPEERYAKDLQSHKNWWSEFWDRSSVDLPDDVIETQWYRDTYKFGAASRKGAPPISLQAVWTADDGRIPPWRGDFHHDLNTQLSYWPCYSGNRLREGEAYLDWLWAIKPVAEEFTKRYFEVNGLNVPGVSTLTGEPLGGWGQYSLSPTTSAWLAHHFDLHWRYSRDRKFLEERAYPWLRAVAVYFDELSMRGDNGKRKLPLSSSPEIHDNRIEAWFHQTTNFDLALIRWLYAAASEMAAELGKEDEAKKWRTILSEWPELARAKDDGRLLVAPDAPLHESHRHFSHLMAIHPLGIVDWENGDADRQTIRAALDELDRLGPSLWVGYSYAWQANLAARGRDGERAAKALRIFAECFCLPNTFHVNGDQTRSGKSNFTYRPFTLEGNFAFASGVQEMLLQSHTGTIRVFPAVPDSWNDVSFRRLRAEGGFLVTAKRAGGEVSELKIESDVGGSVRIENPFLENESKYKVSGKVAWGKTLQADIRPGKSLTIRRKDQN